LFLSSFLFVSLFTGLLVFFFHRPLFFFLIVRFLVFFFFFFFQEEQFYWMIRKHNVGLKEGFWRSEGTRLGVAVHECSTRCEHEEMKITGDNSPSIYLSFERSEMPIESQSTSLSDEIFVDGNILSRLLSIARFFDATKWRFRS